jgi:hypothetical protein
LHKLDLSDSFLLSPLVVVTAGRRGRRRANASSATPPQRLRQSETRTAIAVLSPDLWAGSPNSAAAWLSWAHRPHPGQGALTTQWDIDELITAFTRNGERDELSMAGFKDQFAKLALPECAVRARAMAARWPAATRVPGRAIPCPQGSSPVVCTW